MAGRGFCGIAQDTRLIYAMLAACPELEVTGLVTLPSRFGPIHKFAALTASRTDRLVNQAEFLWRLSAESAGTEPGLPRGIKGLRHAVGAVAARRADVDRLDTGAFWQVLWRELFRCTLLPEHVPLVRDGNFLLTNLQPAMIVARAVLHRRPIMLDTRGYDFLMTQTLRPCASARGHGISCVITTWSRCCSPIADRA